jgi:hypothetical protein
MDRRLGIADYTDLWITQSYGLNVNHLRNLRISVICDHRLIEAIFFRTL